MKANKKIIGVILLAILLMATILSGCGEKTEQQDQESSKPAQTSETTAQATDEKEETVQEEPVTLTAMVQLLPYVSSMTDNTYTKSIEEKLNIILDLTVVPQDGYADKLKIALSTGDYPELIMSNAARSNNDIVNYGIKEQIYIPLNDLINNYAVNFLDRCDEMPEIIPGITAPDGNIYAMPTFEGAVGHGAVSYKAWINVGWLDTLGLEMPETTEDLKNVLIAFKNDDPNGNGEADEVPFSGAINTWAADPYFFILNAFDYYEGSLLKLKDGKFSFTADTEGFKEGLMYLNDLYVNGLIDPAAFTQDLSQLGQLANIEPTVLGCYTAGHIAMGIDTSNMELSKNYDYLLPLEGPSGYRAIPAVTNQTFNVRNFAITDKCMNPEAAIKLIDSQYEPYEALTSRFGPQGEAWDVADPGAKGCTGKDALWKSLPSKNDNVQPMNNYWASATSFGFGKDWKEYMQVEGDLLQPTNYEARLINITNEYLKYAADVDQIMPMWADADTSTKLTNAYTMINDYVKSSIIDFITGKKNVENDWDEYIDGLNKLGYKDYVADYEEAYNND